MSSLPTVIREVAKYWFLIRLPCIVLLPMKNSLDLESQLAILELPASDGGVEPKKPIDVFAGDPDYQKRVLEGLLTSDWRSPRDDTQFLTKSPSKPPLQPSES